MLPQRTSPTFAMSDVSLAALRAALDLTAEAVLFVDPTSLQILDANRAATKLWGEARERLLDHSLTELIPSFQTSPATGADRETVHEVLCRHASGEAFAARLQLARCAAETEEGEVWIAMVQPAADEAPSRIIPSETLDALTGLPTRAALDVRLADAIERARAARSHFALFFIDVDYFKRANDTLGHMAGDQVLRTIAARLSDCLRPNDLVVRFGGDEFVALLDEIHDATLAQQIAQRIGQQLQQPIPYQGGCVTVSASIGIAMSTTTQLDAQSLLHAADQAMYAAKQLGRAGHAVVASG